MHADHTIEIFIGLLIAAAALAWMANRVKLPYPIVLTLGGLGLGFLPWRSIVGFDAEITLKPELVFLLFLPPLLYHAGLMTTWRDFTANARPISMLAIGLVLATTCAVAWVANHFMGFGWPAAFALGAIVSPPDAIAATAITTRLRIPKRLVTILEGESLVNDATALVAYRIAVLAAMQTAAFSVTDASMKFLWVAIAGAAIGVVAGVIMMFVRSRLNDPTIDGALALLTPFVAYLPAEWTGTSGVLAAVAAGIYVGRRQSKIIAARSRLRVMAVWDAVVFMLNGVIFILIGLQFPGILNSLRDNGWRQLIGYAALVSIVAITVRVLWVFPATYVPRWLLPRAFKRDPALPWRHTTVIAWAGMRGIVSLAAAMALPEEFPHRDLIIFLTFAVIFSTLVIQGLTLPFMIIAFGFEEEDEETQEELTARHSTAVAVLARLAEMADAGSAPAGLVERMRTTYDDRVRYLVGRLMGDLGDGVDVEAGVERPSFSSITQLQRELIQVERRALVLLRDQNVIGDDVMRKVEMDLDLEESKLA